ncbi:MAG: MmgE/PrpD family protein [Gaiellaceae bacterium]
MTSCAVDALVDRCRDLAAADLAEPLTRRARHCLLDGFGVAIVGAQTPAASILRGVVGDGSGYCTVLGHPSRARALDAALVNGAAMHALDFDDIHLSFQGHPTAAVLPAVLALAEERDASQVDVLAACVVGVEVAATLGSWVNPQHYDAGWHATGTLGTLGAAAACAHLLRLETAGWMTALALAATQAAGVRGTFGSMAKPLHAGRAAASGLLSAQLSEAGFSCARAALDGPTGFLGIHGGLGQLAEPLTSEGWAIQEVLFKFHAACYMTQAPIINARALVEAHGFEPADVESVEVVVAPELRGVCDIAEPQDALEAKFSLQLLTAFAITGAHTADENALADDLTNPTVRDLCHRVHVRFDPELRGRETCARTTVTMRSGKLATTESDSGEPEQDLDAQEARLVSKFRSLVGKVADADAVKALEEEILRCPTGSIMPALRLAGGETFQIAETAPAVGAGSPAPPPSTA